MIALDTNVLVYSHRAECRLHVPAKDLVKNFAEGTESWAVPWPCVFEFYSVVTNPRIWKGSATTPHRAADQLKAWMDSPSIVLLTEPDDFADVVLPMLRQPRIRGPIVHDARIAALCLAHGVEVLLTRDRDFQLFPQLKTADPFRSHVSS